MESEISGFLSKSEKENVDKSRLKEWNKMLSPSGNEIISTGRSRFYKIMTFLFFLQLIGFGYLIYSDHLKTSIEQPITINPLFNQTTENTNNFNPSTSNQYHNNFSFSFDIDEELVKIYCNNTNSS